ncbi:MAG: hypothetical protein P1V36_02230 [Planctomycetota bacterium]|nr:hypothetical protein [Planctomycetota bacterium]
MRRALSLVLSLALLAPLAACGGGGGGDEPPADTGAPGTLRALALEGAVAPDSGGGTFAAFPTFPIMSAGATGWAAWVAQVVAGNFTEAVYVTQPDGAATTVRVFAQDDAVGGTDRRIADFAGVWMCDNGTVITLANLAGGTATQDFALLAADVAAGAVSNRRTILLDEADLTVVAPGGVLSSINADTLLKEEDGTLWMQVIDGNTGDEHLISIEADGTGLTRRASPGDGLFGGATIANVDAFGVSSVGTFYAIAVTDSSGDQRMTLQDATVNPPVYQQFLQDGNPLPSAGTVAAAYKRGRMVVFSDGSVGWVAVGSLSGADDVYLLYQPAAAPQFQYIELARVPDTAPDTGMGTYASLDTLNMAPSAQRVLFNAAVTPGTFGISHATFRVSGISPLTVRGDSANVVLSNGQVFPAPYINLSQTNRPYDEVASNGDFVYAQTWSGTSAVWWAVRSGPNTNIFAVAAQGGPAPGGDTFGAFTAGVGMTAAPGCVLFRGPVTMSGSGIFRQGP